MGRGRGRGRGRGALWEEKRRIWTKRTVGWRWQPRGEVDVEEPDICSNTDGSITYSQS